MNSKRRAELQRKLSLSAVPRPPAGLRERIRADIPDYLEVQKDRRRFAGAVAFNMRVAAAVLVMVTSLAVAFVFVDRNAEMKTAEPASAARPIVFAPQSRAISVPAASTAEEVRLDITQDTSTSVPMPPQLIAANTVPPSLPEGRERAAETSVAEQDMESAVEGGLSGRVASPIAEGVISMDAIPQTRQIAEAAPSPPPAARAAAPEVMAPPPPPRDAVREERTTVTASAPSAAPAAGFMTKAHAADMSIAPKKSIFGISVDPNAFDEVRATLESGRRPAPNDVDVEALVNYFAGATRVGADDDIRLDVEVSPAAVGADGDHAILRLSVDTSPATTPGSLPPVASNVRIDVDFNEKVVAGVRRIGDAAPLMPEPVILSGTSVTALYAIELEPNLKTDQLVASVRFQYTSVANGHKRTITRRVQSHDLARPWERASRRHRLATLGAVWGETLQGTASALDLAERAEALATQDPKNPRARELADAAGASGGL